MRYFIGLAVLGAAASGIASYLIQTHIEHAEIAVVSKERLVSVTGSDGNTSSSWKNFVYTEAESYIVKDSFWNWHFRAGTIYAQIKEGSVCRVTLSGYRLGFLSMYQNIIGADCASQEARHADQ